MLSRAVTFTTCPPERALIVTVLPEPEVSTFVPPAIVSAPEDGVAVPLSVGNESATAEPVTISKVLAPPRYCNGGV